MRANNTSFRRARSATAVFAGAALCLVAGVIALAVSVDAAPAADGAPLRVCADPDNMPFSNAKGEGFENKIADLVAGELRQPIAYTWRAQDAGFIHDTLNAGRCDVVIGVPQHLRSVATTQPYYWSSYVLVSRADRGLDVTSLKDHRLRGMKIGVASVAGNRLYSPPAQVLAEIGRLDDLVGFPVEMPADGSDPRARVIAAVAAGDIDIAAVWGPAEGYYALHSPVPLTVVRIGDTDEFSSRKTHFHLLGLQFEIAMAVRRGDDLRRAMFDRAIAKKQAEITAVLKRFGVPLIEPEQLAAAAPRHAAE